MRDYLEGDPRFEGVRGDKKAVVLAWTRKEYANLKRALAANVRVPEPIAVQRNALAMEYIGVGGDPAPTLHDVRLENPETAYDVIREYMRRLYAAGLVHGDLSEYNVVVYDGELTIIDVGQAVTVHHPNADDFLRRDCRNVANFFSRAGADADEDELYAFVTATGEENDEAGDAEAGGESGRKRDGGVAPEDGVGGADDGIENGGA